MKRILLTRRELKRIELIDKTSPFENTKWLIQQIRKLMATINQYNKEFQALNHRATEAEKRERQLSESNKRLRYDNIKLKKNKEE